MKKILFLLSVIICSMLIISCNISNDNKEIIITDMEGTKVKIPQDVKSVACISQSATDLMIAFGLGDKITGTYRSFTYNPWIYELYPKSKFFKSYSYSVSAEELLSDGIDLVIIQNTENIESFRNAGLPVVAVHQYSPLGAFDDEIYEIAYIIGEIFGGEAKIKANNWIDDVKSTIKDIKNKIGTTNSEKIVYYINGEKEKGLFYSDGGNSMISSILQIANVRLATEKYDVLNVHNVSDEEMLMLNPYAILIGGTYQNKLLNNLYSSTLWSSLDCSINNRIYRIPVAMIGIENVCAETPVMLKYIANIFNPEYEFDIHDELQKNIKKYFGYNLSNEDIDNMCNALSKNGESIINEK